MAISLRDSITIPADVVFKELNDEAVVLNLQNGLYFGLNDVGTRMWELIAERKTLSEVLARLEDEYAADRQALERDLLELCEQLQAKGLISVSPQ